jgi:hypothetical protein
MTKTIQPAREPAIVFVGRLYPGDWRVERINDEGGIEVAIFAWPDGRASVQVRRTLRGPNPCGHDALIPASGLAP